MIWKRIKELAFLIVSSCLEREGEANVKTMAQHENR